MFRISRAEEQALRLTIRLAARGTQQTLAELAELENLPEPTVAKLLGQLKRGGVAEALRGRNGGYVLADQPHRISVARVLACVGTEASLDYPCVRQNGSRDCRRTRDCGLRSLWRHLDEQVSGILTRTTVADLLLKESQMALVVDQAAPGLWKDTDV